MATEARHRARRHAAAVPKAAIRPVARWYRYLPTARKMRLRRCLYMPLEVAERWTGHSDPMIPPRWLRFVGRGDFVATGEAFRSHFVNLGGLGPADAVLDMGSGIGRMALPLTKFLDEEARYEGFDAVRPAVDWCRTTITPRFPAFTFEHLDVANRRYNPDGLIDAADARFPYVSSSFDFVIATSLFTHLAPDAAERYILEAARVLRPGGTLFATFFLLNDESKRLMACGSSELAFRHPVDGSSPVLGGARTLVEGDADYAVAFDESAVLSLLERAGLRVAEPIRFGDWCGRADHVDHQDIVVATRERHT